MTKRWLVISNCQTVGLANSLSLLCPNVDVVACDIARFRNEADHWKQEIHAYDHLIINPEIQGLGIVNFDEFSNVTWVPGFNFRGFHPDMTNVFCNGAPIKSPMDDYHSVLVFSAFKSGLSEIQARRLFSMDVYEKLGFFEIWKSERSAFIESFAKYGLDLRVEFVKWVRDGGFMHSMNHPRINAVFDLAVKIAQKLEDGVIVDSDIRPHDNLIVGPVYPIFPEVAERYGSGKGSYLFKPGSSYRVLDLNQFIDGSYRVYRNLNSNELVANNPHYAAATMLIAEAV